MSNDAHQPPEIAMTAHPKLTDTQTTILKTAAGRPDGSIEPLPDTLRGGARTKVIDGCSPKDSLLMPMAISCSPMPATPP